MKRAVTTVCHVFLGLMAYGQPTPKLVFSYDKAGNQMKRQYCVGECHVKDAGSRSDETAVSDFESVMMSPNPTSGVLQLHWNKEFVDQLLQVSLANLQGVQLLIQTPSQSESMTLDLSGYPVGIYLAQFVFSDGKTWTRKIVKK